MVGIPATSYDSLMVIGTPWSGPQTLPFQYSHTDSVSPIGSEHLTPAIDATNRLLAAARPKGLAVVYVNTMYRADGRDCGLGGDPAAVSVPRSGIRGGAPWCAR